MPRRPAKITQADVARVARAAAQLDPPGVVSVRPDGSILLLPAALVTDAIAPAAPARPAAEPAAVVRA